MMTKQKTKIEKLKKNDFVEIEYTGKVKNTGEIFDTNIEEEAKKLNLEIKTRPIIICLGQNMILEPIDEFLIGKDIGKEYILELPAERAFGKRNRELIKIMPLSVFREKEVMPRAGMVFAFDNVLGKITAVSGGRVIVDFNNPIAGKDIIYNLKVKNKIKEVKEKIRALMLSFFKREFQFKIEKKKLIIEVEEKFKKFISLFEKKFKEILALDLETSESKNSEGAQKFERTEKISDIKEKAREKN